MKRKKKTCIIHCNRILYQESMEEPTKCGGSTGKEHCNEGGGAGVITTDADPE